MKTLPSGTKLNNTLQELPPSTASGGGSVAVYDEGVLLTAGATSINIVGATATATVVGTDVTMTFTGGSATRNAAMWALGI